MSTTERILEQNVRDEHQQVHRLQVRLAEVIADRDRMLAKHNELLEQVDYFREKARGLFDESVWAADELTAMKDKHDSLLAALIAEQARLDFVLKRAIALYHGQLTWTDENLRTHFVGIAHPETVRSMIDWLLTQDAKKAGAGK